MLIANSEADHLIDWVGEVNSYIVPFPTFGKFAVSRKLQPQLMEYLYDLSEADGADQSRAFDTGGDYARNGEPNGELGLVKQRDPHRHEQIGPPRDPQPGNLPGKKK